MNRIRWSCFAVCCFVLISHSAFAETGLVKVSEHVYSYVDVKDGSPARSFGANAGIVIGEKAILVIDTLVSSREGKRLLSDIREISDRQIRYVVNTHYHLDHTFGNAEFAELGAEIISHVNCAEAMKKSAAATLANAEAYGLTPEAMAGTAPAYPNITFTDMMELDLGGLRVELIYIAPSHSTGSIVVYIPAEKVIFAGDILFTDFHPYMADGDILGWQKTLESIGAMEVDRIIPGHGPLSTNKDLEDMKSYIVAFDKKATELAEKNNEVEYIVDELKKNMLPRTRGEGLIQANVLGKYLQDRNK